MFEWIVGNISTVIISAVIVCIVALVIKRMIDNKKMGKSSCGCGCADCPMSGKCGANGKSTKTSKKD